MKISLVMTTYNGSKYVEEQLNSILNQTLKPDEVIICDDSSTDNTYEIISRFITENKLSNWILIKNSQNLGWKRNFHKVINQAKGDIIFLSDQDDIWNYDKIKTIMESFNKEKSAELFISNYDTKYIGDDNVVIKNSKKIVGKEHVNKICIKGENIEVIRPGCTMAFKKELIDFFNVIWEPDFAHDAILWEIALFRNGAFIINEELIIQVRHEGNSTPSNKKTRKVRIELLKNKEKLLNKILANNELLKIKNVDWLEKYIFFTQKRILTIEYKSLVKWLFLIKYIRLYPKVTSWVGDLISMYR